MFNIEYRLDEYRLKLIKKKLKDKAHLLKQSHTHKFTSIIYIHIYYEEKKQRQF